MNLSFFTKIFCRSVQLSSNFGKTFSYVRGACWYKDKVYQADIYRKNNTCTSCVFNGFKYSCHENINNLPYSDRYFDTDCQFEMFKRGMPMDMVLV